MLGRQFASVTLAATVFALAACAPDPMPAKATPEWTLKNGVVWYWQREAGGGCIDWMATERWVSAQVKLATPCMERGSAAFREARGLCYSSSFDELTFNGYWEWSPELYSSLIVFDEQGNWAETLTCPYQLNEAQLAEMRVIVAEAQEQSLSAGETHVLARIAERLAETDGKALGSSQSGCDHEPSDPAWREPANRPDPWAEAHSTGT